MQIRTTSVVDVVRVYWVAEDPPYIYRTMNDFLKSEWDAMTPEEREALQTSMFEDWKAQVQGGN